MSGDNQVIPASIIDERLEKISKTRNDVITYINENIIGLFEKYETRSLLFQVQEECIVVNRDNENILKFTNPEITLEFLEQKLFFAGYSTQLNEKDQTLTVIVPTISAYTKMIVYRGENIVINWGGIANTSFDPEKFLQKFKEKYLNFVERAQSTHDRLLEHFTKVYPDAIFPENSKFIEFKSMKSILDSIVGNTYLSFSDSTGKLYGESLGEFCVRYSL